MESRLCWHRVLALVLVLHKHPDDRVGRGLVGGGHVPDEQETVADHGECLYGGTTGGPSFGHGRQ